MFIPCVACLCLLIALPAWTQSPDEGRLHIPVWDISDIYSRITGALHAPHKQQPVQKKKVNPAAISDYYNNYWEEYYYHNPPYVEYVPRPPKPPRPTRRPSTTTRRPRRTTRSTTSTSTTTPAATTSTTTPATTSSTTTSTSTSTSTTTTLATTIPTTIPPETTTEFTNSTSPPSSEPIRKFIVNSYDDNLEVEQVLLKPEQQLSIKSPPKSMRSLCQDYPRLCLQPDESQFLELIDGNGNPLILIYPGTTKTVQQKSYKPTRRPYSQRIHSKGIYGNSVRIKARRSPYH